MSRSGLLQSVGHSRKGVFNQVYLQSGGLPKSQASGDLWLSETLGPSFVVSQYSKAVVAIVGHDQEGDEHCGSGLAIGPRHVLTCAHVLTDMAVDGVLLTGDHASAPPAEHSLVPVTQKHIQETVDVGVLELAQEVVHLPGTVFREPAWADSILTFGYPPVPLARRTVLTVQSGEVVNPEVTSVHGDSLFLFSAISRPGNSGGPVVGADGRVLGLVARDLGRKGEGEAVFFAGLPTGAIRSAMVALDLDRLLTYETWH
jgi:S1-C subfamily serine protease